MMDENAGLPRKKKSFEDLCSILLSVIDRKIKRQCLSVRQVINGNEVIVRTLRSDEDNVSLILETEGPNLKGASATQKETGKTEKAKTAYWGDLTLKNLSPPGWKIDLDFKGATGTIQLELRKA